jgi:hypothetical protein
MLEEILTAQLRRVYHLEGKLALKTNVPNTINNAHAAAAKAALDSILTIDDQITWNG